MRILGAAVAFTLLLAGCSAPPATMPSTSPEATPSTSTPTPEPVAAVASEIVVSSSTLQVMTTDGHEASSHTWFDSPTQTIERLTESFGFAPTTTEHEATELMSARTDYAWEGFLLTVLDVAPQAPYYPNQYATITASSVGGIHLSTLGGISVGSTLAQVETLAGTDFFGASAPDGPGRIYALDLVELALPDGATDRTRVFVFVSETTGTVFRIVAPSKYLGS